MNPMKRLLAFVLALMLTAACGSSVEPPDGGLLAKSAARGGVTLPEPKAAAPAFVVASDEPLDDGTVAKLGRAPGVVVVAPMKLEKMTVRGPSGPLKLRVGAVDPLEYRSVAPTVTRQAEFVWNSLLAGEAVVTFEAADRLDLDGGGDIRLARRGIHVGAFADNGAPNVADVLVDLSVGQQLNLGGNEVLTIGARSGTPVDLLGKQLERRAPGALLLPLIPAGIASNPDPRGAPLEGTAGGGLIGRMDFRVLDDGFIEPAPAWVEQNIAAGEVPLLGEVTCHRLLIPQLAAALNEIAERGLAGEIDPAQYGGCYVPRFVDRNPDLPLSMHAFGLAVDLNVATNQLGTAGDMDPRVVQIFERWGFVWGGEWSRPDPMHFELARLIDL